MLKILIPVDGSPHAQRAIEAAARLQAKTREMDVILLHVRQWPIFMGEVPPVRYEEIDEEETRHQKVLLDDALAAARRCGLELVSAVGEKGEAATEIARVAQDRGVDQILMGTHGRGTVGTLLMGSVAQRVVHLAKVPVVLVK